jgi:AcrR family transcriptional regulator
MPLPRYERLDVEKKRKLLEAAMKEFIAKGYEGASLNDILSAAELGKSSYYYYFADKEDLYATVVEDMFARLDSAAPQPKLDTLTATTFWPALEAYAVAATDSLVRAPEQVMLLVPLHGMWREPSPRLAPLAERTRSQYRIGIEVGRRLGCIRTDIDADVLIALAEAADWVIDQRFLRQWEITPAKIKAHATLAFDTFRRLVEPTPHARP